MPPSPILPFEWVIFVLVQLITQVIFCVLGRNGGGDSLCDRCARDSSPKSLTSRAFSGPLVGSLEPTLKRNAEKYSEDFNHQQFKFLSFLYFVVPCQFNSMVVGAGLFVLAGNTVC